jgi:hypothetical protein
VNTEFAEFISEREREREREREKPGLGAALKEVKGGEDRAEAIERQQLVKLKNRSILDFYFLCCLIYLLRRHVAEYRARFEDRLSTIILNNI